MTAVPSSMRALVLESPGHLRVAEVPVPAPGPGELLIRVHAATTCGTDLKAYLRGHPQIPMPGLFGHEYAGVVAAAGDGARFAVGDAVMGVHSAPCQACRWCQRGQENLCESIMATKVLGSYAQFLLVPERIARLNVFGKPEGLSFEQASLLEPLSCVAQGIRELTLRPDDRALVIGPGAIGLMFARALESHGLASVTVSGRNAARLAIGAEMGFETVPLGDLHGTYDIVIECTGTVDIWERSIDFVGRGGTLMLFGGCPAGTRASFDTKKVHYDQITILSPFHFGTDSVRTAAEWLARPGFDLGPLISGERTLDEAVATFDALRQGQGIKYVFRP